jgi:molybdopterin/thiamine biosynthesis adenylyltransferase
VSALRLPPGALEAEARSRLGASRALIVGTGGIGGTMAHELARSGLASLTLVDFDVYTEGNLDRQIGCYAGSIGRPKAEVLAEDLRRIGAVGEEGGIRCITERRRASGFEREFAEADLVVAAADDYAFSLALMDRALDAGLPTCAALPVGAWAAVALFLPGGPRPASLFGLPRRSREEGYAEEIARKRRAIARFVERRSGAPFTEALRLFAEGRGSPPQLCPMVWSAASILALEAVKLLAGFGAVVVAPRWYELSARGLGVRTSFPGLLSKRFFRKER